MKIKIKRIFDKVVLPIFVSVVFLVLYLPLTVLVIFSFNDASFPAPWRGFSSKWYFELLQTPEIWRAFYTSVLVGICATFLSITTTLSLIYHNLMGGRLKKLLLIFYGNILVPEIVLAVALLCFLTFLAVPLGLLTLIVAHTILCLGYVLPIVYGRYLAFDKSIIEASLDLGATMSNTFFKVVLPILKPSLIAAGLLSFIISFDDFVLSFFCAGSDTQTLSLFIYSMIRSGVSPVVNALSTILLFLSSLLVLVFCYLNIKTKIF